MENFENKRGGRFEGDDRSELRGDTFETKDSPSEDSYDDGLGEDGKMRMPGSTSTESGGTYMESKGPNDLRRRENSGDGALVELDPEVSVRDEADVEGPVGTLDEETGDFMPEDDEEDAAAKWLRENDPDLK